MNKQNCALKLVDEITLYYDARSKKHQITSSSSSSFSYSFSYAYYYYYYVERLIADVSRSHTIKHTHGRNPLNDGSQLIPEAATYTTHHGRTSMSSAGFEPASPAIKRLQT